MKVIVQNFGGTVTEATSQGVDFVLGPGAVVTLSSPVTIQGTNYAGKGTASIGVGGVVFTPAPDATGQFFLGFGLGLAVVATAVSFSFVRSIGGARQSWAE